MSFCKLFAVASLFVLASCMDDASTESQEPAQSVIDQALELPNCAPGDPYFEWFQFGTCGDCKLANGQAGQSLKHYISCESDTEGTKVFQGKFCSTCLTVPPPKD